MYRYNKENYNTILTVKKRTNKLKAKFEQQNSFKTGKKYQYLSSITIIVDYCTVVVSKRLMKSASLQNAQRVKQCRSQHSE